MPLSIAAGSAIRWTVKSNNRVRLLEQQAEPERSGSGTPIEIELAQGRRVCVPRGFEAEDLQRVLVVLGEVAAC